MDLCGSETSTGIPSQSHIVMSVTKVNGGGGGGGGERVIDRHLDLDYS